MVCFSFKVQPKIAMWPVKIKEDYDAKVHLDGSCLGWCMTLEECQLKMSLFAHVHFIYTL